MSVICNDDYPRTHYIPHKRQERASGDRSFKYVDLHWGQRKLFLNELSALTRYTHPEGNYLCVYAGAANGEHLPFLASLFPNVVFHLYDPAPFHSKVHAHAKTTGQFVIHQGLFTDEVVVKYAPGGSERKEGRDLIFISDIRHDVGNDPGKAERFEAAVIEDMDMQRKWVLSLDPLFGVLKFRPPYPKPGVNPQYEYLKGDIYFQAYAPVTSTECRLIVSRGAGNRVYDIQQYEEQCAYFNQQRVLRSRGETVDGFALKDIWSGLTPHLGLDCKVETEIILSYFQVKTVEELRTVITTINLELHGTLFQKLKQ